MSGFTVIVTGLGVVAPNGIGKDAFWDSCLNEVSGIKAITRFDATAYGTTEAGEISDFHPERYLGSKGLRNLDRTTLLALVATKLALEDAGLTIDETMAATTGVILGSTMGSVHSIANFDLEALREGPRYVNPAQFSNTVINSPASQIAIRFGIRGLNATIGTGFTASYNAIEYALDMIRLGRATRVVVGGVEELCVETLAGFYGIGLLKPSRNGGSSNGTENTRHRLHVGEGAGILILEAADAAIDRGARNYGEVLGASSRFTRIGGGGRDPVAQGSLNSMIEEVVRSLDESSEPIDVVCGDDFSLERTADTTASSSLHWQHVRTRHFSLEPLTGECFSAMGALEIIAGIGVGRACGARRLLVKTTSPVGVQAVLLIRLAVDHAERCKSAVTSGMDLENGCGR